MTFAMAVTGTLVSVGGVAHADVPRGTITHIYLNLNAPSITARSEYGAFISSLRQAAGHPFRDGVLQTQRVDPNNPYSAGLIMVTLTHADTTLTLWIIPWDLYVRGFTNMQGWTYQFPDNCVRICAVQDVILEAIMLAWRLEAITIQ